MTESAERNGRVVASVCDDEDDDDAADDESLSLQYAVPPSGCLVRERTRNVLVA